MNTVTHNPSKLHKLEEKGQLRMDSVEREIFVNLAKEEKTKYRKPKQLDLFQDIPGS